MAWVKLDDQFFINRKARSVGLEGRALFLASVCYCGMQLNDGRFCRQDVPVIAALAEVNVDTAERLFAAGLWHLSEDDTEIVEVHDYLRWNRSRQQVIAAENAGRKAAQARHGADGNANRTAKRKPKGNAEPTTESDLDLDGLSVLSSSGNSRANGARPDDDELSTGVPEETWDAYAELKLRREGNVRNPVPWKRRCAQNARTELGEQANAWWAMFDLTPRRLAECLIDGQVRNVPRRQEAS